MHVFTGEPPLTRRGSWQPCSSLGNSKRVADVPIGVTKWRNRSCMSVGSAQPVTGPATSGAAWGQAVAGGAGRRQGRPGRRTGPDCASGRSDDGGRDEIPDHCPLLGDCQLQLSDKCLQGCGQGWYHSTKRATKPTRHPTPVNGYAPDVAGPVTRCASPTDPRDLLTLDE